MFISWISDAAQTWWKWNVELPVDLCTPEVTVHLSGCKCKWCRKPESWFEAARKKKHSPTLVGLPEAQRVKWKPLATLAEDDTLAIAEPEGAEVAPGCLSTMFMGLRQAAKATGPALRDGWVAVPHPEGGVYYWNTSTNQTSLEPVLAIEVPTPEPVVLVERWSSQPGPAQVPARHVLAGFFCSLGFSSANDPELHEERQTGLASRHAGKSYKTHLDTPLEELL
eukprot:s2675_g2.t1